MLRPASNLDTIESYRNFFHSLGNARKIPTLGNSMDIMRRIHSQTTHSLCSQAAKPEPAPIFVIILMRTDIFSALRSSEPIWLEILVAREKKNSATAIRAIRTECVASGTKKAFFCSSSSYATDCQRMCNRITLSCARKKELTFCAANRFHGFLPYKTFLALAQRK